MRAVDGNTNTIAHEIGHNHGRNHAPACGAAGPDDDFPYMNGAMGVNGFSLSTMALKSKAQLQGADGLLPSALDQRLHLEDARGAGADQSPRCPRQGATTTMLETRSLQAYAAVGERPEWGVVSGHLVDAGAAARPPAGPG